jgi:hypothetical protein
MYIPVDTDPTIPEQGDPSIPVILTPPLGEEDFLRTKLLRTVNGY